MTKEEAYEFINKFPRCRGCDDDSYPLGCDECDDAFYTALKALKQPDQAKGNWIRNPDGGCLKCDQCGMLSMNVQKFCCGCGADMRGEQE